MQLKLNVITRWLSQSGLKVNEEKTELCLFHRKDHPLFTIKFSNTNLKSKSNMNALGVAFDSKLNWQFQVQTPITKAKKSPCHQIDEKTF